jgi:hypothetical protein
MPRLTARVPLRSPTSIGSQIAETYEGSGNHRYSSLDLIARLFTTSNTNCDTRDSRRRVSATGTNQCQHRGIDHVFASDQHHCREMGARW